MNDVPMEAIKRIEEQLNKLSELHPLVQRVVVALDGDQFTDTKGIRGRVRETEARISTIEGTLTAQRLVDRLGVLETQNDLAMRKVDTLQATIDKYRWIIYGMGLGLGITGISSIGSLLLQVFRP